MNFWCLIFLIFYFVFIESGKIRPNFDEIFGNGWNNKNESEEIVIKIEQNEPNENLEVDQMVDGMGIHPNNQQKREIIFKFDAIKDKLKEKGKFHYEKRVKIDITIGKLLGVNRTKIYKWKNELNLNKKKIMKKSFYEQKKREFIERFDEFKCLYKGKQKEFVKELGISEFTFLKWKKELLPNYNKTQIKYSNEDKFKMMKQYFEIKEGNSKISDEKIAKKLGIAIQTLIRWKKKFT